MNGAAIALVSAALPLVSQGKAQFSFGVSARLIVMLTDGVEFARITALTDDEFKCCQMLLEARRK